MFEDPRALRIVCVNAEDIVRTINSLMPRLTPSDRDRFNFTKACYLQRFGIDGLHRRTVGRTVAEVIEQFDDRDSLDVVTSGERDTVKYVVLESPTECDGAKVAEREEDRNGPQRNTAS